MAKNRETKYHLVRKSVTWKTECGLEVEKVKCFDESSQDAPAEGSGCCTTCVRIRKTVNARASSTTIPELSQ